MIDKKGHALGGGGYPAIEGGGFVNGVIGG